PHTPLGSSLPGVAGLSNLLGRPLTASGDTATSLRIARAFLEDAPQERRLSGTWLDDPPDRKSSCSGGDSPQRRAAMAGFADRLKIARLVLDRPWVKVALFGWAAICTYDTLLSQFVPESLAKKFPKMHEVIEATTGLIPYWGWLLILFAILTIASFEYA